MPTHCGIPSKQAMHESQLCSNCYHVSDQQQHQIPGGSAKTFGYPTSSTLAVCALTSSKSRAKSTPVSSSSTTNSALTPTSSSTSSRAKSTPVFSSCSRAKSTEGRCRQIDFRNQRVNSTLAAGITTEARFKKYAARDSSFFYRYFYQGVVVKRLLSAEGPCHFQFKLRQQMARRHVDARTLSYSRFIQCFAATAGYSEEEREAVLLEKSTHLNEAIAQRRFVSNFVKEYTALHAPQQVLPNEIIPDTTDDVAAVDEVDIDDDERATKKVYCRVQILAEDYGGGISMPYYGICRPSADYFNSNLMIQNFVIADVSNGQYNVYFYDERSTSVSRPVDDLLMK
ncbi:hypothetical protein PC121_g19772 [Phytophthora cactorum]|nr:hypothetical protein PC121_g19772 [Phytophthora cactorum]